MCMKCKAKQRIFPVGNRYDFRFFLKSLMIRLLKKHCIKHEWQQFNQTNTAENKKCSLKIIQNSN
jgi:hypothetical protein